MATVIQELVPLLFIPKNLEQAAELASNLDVVAAAHYWQCLGIMLGVFIVLQSLNIPGTIFLNVVMGGVFGIKEGITLGVVSGTIGATVAFTISKRWGKSIVSRAVAATGMEEKVKWFSNQVEEHSSTDLLSFLLFLRISPVLPNWFITAVSPHVGVPLLPLAVATFFGIAPQTFLAVHTGAMLRTMIDSGATTPIGPKEWAGLLVLGLVALLPVAAKHLFKSSKPPSKTKAE